MQVQEGSFCTADNESMGPLLAMLSLLDDPCFIQFFASNLGLKEVGGEENNCCETSGVKLALRLFADE